MNWQNPNTPAQMPAVPFKRVRKPLLIINPETKQPINLAHIKQINQADIAAKNNEQLSSPAPPHEKSETRD